MLEEDSREVEPIMIDILNLVKTNPDSRALFINLFIEVADGKYDAPPFLLPFCMRELRFIEIKDHLIQQLNDKQNTPYIARKMNLISDVMHAFDDEVWKDADFWPYYAREMN